MDKSKSVLVSEQELEIQKGYSQKVRAYISAKYDYQPLAHVHSYGCQQNVSDGEKIKGILALMGYGFTNSTQDADLIVYNTCAVRESAESRVFGNVGALKGLKKLKPSLTIALCGCMMQQQHVADKIKNSYPYVDIVFGTHAMHQLPQMLYERFNNGRRIFEVSESDGVIAEGLPVSREGGVKSWLPIMYGCDNFCTYCIVPFVRGRERSRTSEAIISEAKALISEGYKEITLLGQNVNSYGKGLDEKITFSQLLRKLNDIDGDFRIRFMTSHPKDCTTELIDTIAECNKICNHIHLPVQSGSDRILKLMNRHYNTNDYLKLIEYAKNKIPNVSFTSDIIVGFPGETYEDFQKTIELIKKVEYTSLYTFIYSKRSGTKAAEFEDIVSESEKSRWFRELLDIQETIGIKQHSANIGKTLRVLADGEGKTGEDYLTGRTESNIIVEFKANKTDIGSFVNVKINKAMNWAIAGEKINI